MVGLILVPKVPVPEDASTTQCALMQRLFCCITGEKANVYVGKKCVRKFQHCENGMLKLYKLHKTERLKSGRMFKKLTERGPILLCKKAQNKATAKPTKASEKTV